MGMPKIPKRLLNRTVYLTKPGLTLKNGSSLELNKFKIDKVMLNPNMGYYDDRGLLIQKGTGNWQMFYQTGYSTPLIDQNGKEFKFSMGDNIIIMPENIITKIVSIKMMSDENGQHHWVLWMD